MLRVSHSRGDLVHTLADRIVSLATAAQSAWAWWRAPPAEADAARRAAGIAAERLSALGILVVRPGASPSHDPGPAAHRHVALFCFDDRDRRQASRWVSRLARASPRAHLVVDLTGAARGARSAIAGDAGNDRGASGEAGEIAAVDRLVGRLELDHAEARLSALAIAAALERRGVSPAVRSRIAAVRFWQGRFDETRDWAFGTDEHVFGWTGLHAWARGDPVARRRAFARVPPGTFWHRVHAVLREVDRGHDVIAACDGLREAVPDWLQAVALAIEADALIAAGQRERMARALDRPPTPLMRCVGTWLRARVSSGGRESAAAEIRRCGAVGVMRLGGGRISMQWLHMMPALLEIVRDAEDDLAAMSGACQWLVRHAGATKAVIVDGAHQRWLAGESWTRADWLREPLRPGGPAGIALAGEGEAGIRRAPVRYRGETIAHLLAATVGAVTTIQPALEAVAALLGPAVRARLDVLAATAKRREAVVPELIGRSPAIAAVRDEIVKAAAVPFPVLVEGESGTGKELVARAIHRLSARRDRRFCAVNCAALSDELVEAELFGHARGAFTGAIAPRAGLFEEAHAGTLFLDEVGELSPRAQAKLLRAVQEREIRRVGENAARAVDVRLVAATNVGLQDAVGANRFRADLHFRLAVIRVNLPPLRQRLEDIPLLAEAFWREVTQATSTRARLGPDALAGLTRHTWPGNVRELQNAIAALVMIAPDRGRVGARHVRQVLGAHAADTPWVSLTAARRTFEQRTIATALARHAGRRTAAARELGISRQGLAKAIKRLGLAEEDERASGVA